MKLNIDNVCKVNNAEIEMDGVTVIAGYNDTGKSTILKSIDAFLKIFGNKDANIEMERWNSVQRLILKKEALFDEMGFATLPRSILYDIFDVIHGSGIAVSELGYELFKNSYLKVIRSSITIEIDEEKKKILLSDDFIIKLYQGMDEIKSRSAQEYWEYRTTLDLRMIFNGVLTNLINHRKSVIASDNNQKVIFGEDKVDVSGGGVSTGNIIYIETRNLLDDLSRGSSISPVRRFLFKEPQIKAYEEFDEIEKNKKALNDIFKEVLHGKLQKDDDMMKYHDDRIGELINLRNVASGMKSLLVIQRLVENGTLTSGSWLLIDEPETNLHPEWHIRMAEILVLIKKEMDINVIVSSHSAYFIRALEVKLAANQMKDCGNFYLMEPHGDMFDVVNVSHNTEKIYAQLYKPLEEL